MRRREFLAHLGWFAALVAVPTMDGGTATRAAAQASGPGRGTGGSGAAESAGLAPPSPAPEVPTLVYAQRDGAGLDIVVEDDRATAVTDSVAVDIQPAWTPDGDGIVFVRRPAEGAKEGGAALVTAEIGGAVTVLDVTTTLFGLQDPRPAPTRHAGGVRRAGAVVAARPRGRRAPHGDRAGGKPGRAAVLVA